MINSDFNPLLQDNWICHLLIITLVKYCGRSVGVSHWDKHLLQFFGIFLCIADGDSFCIKLVIFISNSTSHPLRLHLKWNLRTMTLQRTKQTDACSSSCGSSSDAPWSKRLVKMNINLRYARHIFICSSSHPYLFPSTYCTTYKAWEESQALTAHTLWCIVGSDSTQLRDKLQSMDSHSNIIFSGAK